MGRSVEVWTSFNQRRREYEFQIEICDGGEVVKKVFRPMNDMESAAWDDRQSSDSAYSKWKRLKKKIEGKYTKICNSRLGVVLYG